MRLLNGFSFRFDKFTSDRERGEKPITIVRPKNLEWFRNNFKWFDMLFGFGSAKLVGKCFVSIDMLSPHTFYWCARSAYFMWRNIIILPHTNDENNCRVNESNRNKWPNTLVNRTRFIRPELNGASVCEAKRFVQTTETWAWAFVFGVYFGTCECPFLLFLCTQRGVQKM